MYQTMQFPPFISDFGLIHLRLDLLGTPLVFTIPLFQLFWNLIIITEASSHPIISKVMCYSSLQWPHTFKTFDPWGMECVLILLQIWVATFFITNCKPAWKTASLLACVTAKYCSYLTLLHTDNQYLFLQCHAAIFVPVSDVKMDWLDHLTSQICS